MRNGRPASVHLDLALRLDLIDLVLEQADDMRRIEGRGDGHHARASGMRCAAASTAAPPRLWPIRIAGAP